MTRKRFELGLSLLVGLAGAAIVLLGDRAGANLWAWRFLGFVGWPLRAALALAILALALPVVQAWIARIFRRCLSWPAWPLPLISGVVFWWLRERTHRGDGLYKLTLLDAHTVQSDPYIWKEPLDSLLAYTATGWLRRVGASPEVAVGLLSLLAGLVYVVAALEASRHLAPHDRGPRVLVFLGLLALGSSQLWFGHVENYSLVTAFCMLSVALALGYLAGTRPLWPAGLAAGAAVSFHPQALFALPALLLLLDRRRWPRQVATLAAASAIVPVLTVAVLLAAGRDLPDLRQAWGGGGGVFWTFPQALAPGRLLDALNNLWLVAPLLPWLILAGGRALILPGSGRDRRFRYLTAVALGFLVYHFSLRNALARWYDWDLFAIVGPPLTLWGLYAWLRVSAGQSARRGLTGALSVALPPAFAFAVAVTAAWVGVNHAFTLLRVTPAYWDSLERYRVADLVDLLPQATVSPQDPICADPASDPTGCQRVTRTQFVLPGEHGTRSAIFAHAPARISLPLDVPAGRSFLWLSPALDPLAWEWGGDGVTFEAHVEADGEDALLWQQRLAPGNPADRAWGHACLRLDAYQGRRITLVLVTDPGPAGDASADRAGWGWPWLIRGTPEVCDAQP